MEKLTIELVYGRALFEAAKDGETTHEVFEELKGVSEVFAEYPLLRKLFSVPCITVHEKKAAAERIFSGHISQELLNFIFILIDKRRVGAWDGIVREYEKLLLEREGHAKGIIYSVIPLEEDKIKAFEFKTASVVGKRVQLENRIDESLLGGVKVYIDNRLIDASVKTHIDSLKQRVMQ